MLDADRAQAAPSFPNALSPRGAFQNRTFEYPEVGHWRSRPPGNGLADGFVRTTRAVQVASRPAPPAVPSLTSTLEYHRFQRRADTTTCREAGAISSSGRMR
jgi:hypothetical protein